MTTTAGGPSTQKASRVPWQAKFAALVVMWGSSFLLMMVALRHYTAWQIVTARIAHDAEPASSQGSPVWS